MMGKHQFAPKPYYQVSLDRLVPQDHLLRQISEAIDLMHALKREQGVTFIVTTHDLDVASSASRIVHLINARIEEALNASM
jgi:predicted ABC-type transport system involved in lysophospholipase L1 biosynthesis ATPase subunit